MDAVAYWNNVEKHDFSRCWVWKRCKNKKGYGLLQYDGPDGMERHQKSHRMAWRLSFGPIKKGLHICHKCDNPSCCNPSHLFMGTNHENVLDKMEKGRMQRGENTSRAKLNPTKVREIRTKYKANEFLSMETLGKEYGVTPGSIYNVIAYISWSHIDPEGITDVPHKPIVGERTGKSKLTGEKVRQIRELHDNGIPQNDLAVRFKVIRQTIANVISRKTWKHII